MRFVKMIFFGLIGIIIFIFLFSLFLPSDTHVKRENMIYAPQQLVFQQLNDLRHQQIWNPWTKTDSNIIIKMGEPTVGESAYFTWYNKDKQQMAGKYMILHSQYDSIIDFRLKFKGMPAFIGQFLLQTSPDGNGVDLKWVIDTHVGWTPWWKLYGLMFDKLIGSQLDAGIQSLKNYCEAQAPAAKDL